MLSVHKVRSGVAYHAYLTAEYYFGENDAAEWFGQGAESLRLNGEVKAKALAALMGGYGAGGAKLVASAGTTPDPATGKGGHQCGWDLTFSAPKAFGVLWSAADDDERKRLEAHHVAAVKESLSYIEQVGSSVRVKGQGRTSHEPCGLVVALFNHDRSRANDPQPHTHAFVANVGVTKDSATRTLDSGGFYALKMAAGALYRASLANRLRDDLGLEVEAEKVGFTVRGVPRALVELYSKRRNDVLERLDELTAGKRIRRASSRAAELAALATRPKKHKVAAGESRKSWQDTNREHGFTGETVRGLFGRAQKGPAPDLGVVVKEATRELTKTQSHFSESELVRHTAERCQDGQAGAQAIRDAVAAALKNGKEFVPLGRHKWEQSYTTPEMLQVEKQLLGNVAALKAADGHRVAQAVVDRFTAKRFPAAGARLTDDERTRNREQKAAVDELTAGSGGIALLAGMAGTGKTTVLRTCKDIWEKAGYRVTGIALAGVAAENLREKAGIESDTLAMRLAQLGQRGGVAAGAKHAATQMLREAAGLSTRPRSTFKLDAKTVVVLDEAGMVGTRQLGELVRHVTAAGAKLVLAGDGKQLQPIEAGGPFGSIARRVGAAVLQHITRQKLQGADATPAWARDAVRHFAGGRAEAGLKLFAERGLVHVGASRVGAMKRMVRDWEAAGGLRKPADHAILAATNREAAAVNAMCQRRRLRASALGRLAGSLPGRLLKGAVVEHDGVKERVLLGDRVLFTEKSRPLGIENGHFGTVRGVKLTTGGKVLTVRLDGGKKVFVPVSHYKGLRLGYAATTHKLQGATCERAYVLLGGSMQDLHLSYVQGSRAVEATRFYADTLEAGVGTKDLARQMSQSREKVLAHDVLEGVGAPSRGRRQRAGL